ncbi:hypothetical protein GDO81_003905 [Engystomops pustulosus]|uniref:Zinc finger double-stranded RNA binding domain-containing protein n=1 Tax=Engystomops pustulosus TaxID=76066 RepID=A0AAV6ZZQ6_ENGPU|nr:hypothetical protein GDO81_003905 [Engystomops pustulosus]
MEESTPNPVNPETPFFCHLCSVYCASALNLQSHFLGNKHRATEESLRTPKPSAEEEEQDEEKPEDEKPLVTLQEHIDTCKDSEPAVGLEYIYQYRRRGYYTYECTLCDCKAGLTHMFMHIVGAKHRIYYLGKHHPSLGISGPYIMRGPKKLKKLRDICLKVEKEFGRQKINEEKPHGPFDPTSVFYVPDTETEQLDFTCDDYFSASDNPEPEHLVTFLELKAAHLANPEPATSSVESTEPKVPEPPVVVVPEPEFKSNQDLLEFLDHFRIVQIPDAKFVITVVEMLSLALLRFKRMSKEKDAKNKLDSKSNAASECRNKKQDLVSAEEATTEKQDSALCALPSHPDKNIGTQNQDSTSSAVPANPSKDSGTEKQNSAPSTAWVHISREPKIDKQALAASAVLFHPNQEKKIEKRDSVPSAVPINTNKETRTGRRDMAPPTVQLRPNQETRTQRGDMAPPTMPLHLNQETKTGRRDMAPPSVPLHPNQETKTGRWDMALPAVPLQPNQEARTGRRDMAPSTVPFQPNQETRTERRDMVPPAVPLRPNQETRTGRGDMAPPTVPRHPNQETKTGRRDMAPPIVPLHPNQEKWDTTPSAMPYNPNRELRTEKQDSAPSAVSSYRKPETRKETWDSAPSALPFHPQREMRLEKRDSAPSAVPFHPNTDIRTEKRDSVSYPLPSYRYPEAKPETWDSTPPAGSFHTNREMRMEKQDSAPSSVQSHPSRETRDMWDSAPSSVSFHPNRDMRTETWDSAPSAGPHHPNREMRMEKRDSAPSSVPFHPSHETRTEVWDSAPSAAPFLPNRDTRMEKQVYPNTSQNYPQSNTGSRLQVPFASNNSQAPSAPQPTRGTPAAPPRFSAPPLFPIAKNDIMNKFFESLKTMEIPEVISTLNKITATNPAFRGMHVPSLVRYLTETGKLKPTQSVPQSNQ